jgi:Uma2 family endonuclease
MAMAVLVPRYTLEDLASFPDDGNRYELVDGILLVTPAPLVPHQLVLSRIVEALTLYLVPSGKARAFYPGSVEVEPNLHMEPDALVVPSSEIAVGIDSPGRWTQIRAWWLAVEVSGKSSRIYDRDHKRPAYLAVGVREVWRADLNDGAIYVSTHQYPDERSHSGSLVWLPPEMAQSLVLDVASVFHGVSGDPD